MKHASEVIPGILEKDITKIVKRAKLIAPYVDWIHIDIADGKFVPNTTYNNPSSWSEVVGIGKNLELHMMVENPFSVSSYWIKAGFKRLLLHIEAVSEGKTQYLKLQRRIQDVKEQDIEVGLAVDRDTKVEVIEPFLDVLDCVLIMTVKAGFSNQQFIPEMLDKVRRIRLLRPSLPIEVDGGINETTGVKALQAGATRFVSTGFIFNSSSIEKALWILKNLKA